MSSTDSERNLAFCALAVQSDFLNCERMLAAMRSRMHDATDLGDLLVRQGALTEDRRRAVDVLVDRHLASTDPGVTRSLTPSPVNDAEATSTFSGTRFPTHAFDRSASDERYRILRYHAEGGLGLVSVARDSELNREVAFKEIKPQRSADEECRARFVLEAEITAKLEQPSVVPVYGFGCRADGRPYYAMRFIRGESFKLAIARFHASKDSLTGTERNLAFRDLLDRFVDVCRAIDYAHSRDILHRDIKPANVMLGDFGETLVVDWGLAKDLNATDRVGDDAASRRATTSSESYATIDGSTIGTPAYMSPEQAEGKTGEITKRSDVYSLGAMLATLLSGRLPVEAKGADETLRMVRSGRTIVREPAPPDMPKALWAIAAKAMSVGAADRYEGAGDLQEDVERFLADEPVSALKESWPTRLRRAARKRPGVTAASSAVAILSLLFLIVGLGAALQVNRELAELNADLEAETERAESARKTAEENYGLARDAVDRYLTQVSESRLLDEPYMDELRRELLASARNFYERFADRRRDDRAAQRDLALAHLRLGQIDWRLGDHERAIAELRDGIDVATSAEIDRAATNLPVGVVLRLRLASYLAQLGDLDESSTSIEAAMQELDEFAGADRNDPEFAYVESDLLFARGKDRRGRNDVAGAERDFALAADILEPFVATGDADASSKMATCCTELGYLAFAEKKNDDAERWFERALSLRRRNVEANPDSTKDSVGLADSLSNLSAIMRRRSRPTEAIAFAREAVETYRTVADEHPGVTEYRRSLAGGLSNLSTIYLTFDDLDKADEANGESVEALSEIAARFPNVAEFAHALGVAESNQGNNLAKRRRWADAVFWYERSIATLDPLLRRSDDPRVRSVLRNSYWGIADARVATADFPAAATAYERAVAMADDRTKPEIRMAMALSLAKSGDRAGATTLAEELLAEENVMNFLPFEAARVYAAAALSASENGPSNIDEIADRLNRRAVELLRRASDQGYFGTSPSAADFDVPEFEKLREREDFREWRDSVLGPT